MNGRDIVPTRGYGCGHALIAVAILYGIPVAVLAWAVWSNL